MQFVDTLEQVDRCYCDSIVNYDDINLTAMLVPSLIQSTRTITVTAYAGDDTLIGDVASFFDITETYNSVHLESKRIPESLCVAKCFYINVKIYENFDSGKSRLVFDKYAGCMKIENCCILAKGIQITF